MSEGRPLKVGVTGGIGSGKSIVCRMFSLLGIPVYDSDRRARELMEEDRELAQNIISAFGEGAYRDGKPDRKYLADRVFQDPKALERLNGLVHPAVNDDIRKWRQSFGHEAPYTIVESAIIFESGLQGTLDKTVTVSAPEELRIRRAMERDGVDRGKIEARMANQITDARREELADITIRNDETVLVWPQVLAIDSKLRSGTAERQRL